MHGMIVGTWEILNSHTTNPLTFPEPLEMVNTNLEVTCCPSSLFATKPR